MSDNTNTNYNTNCADQSRTPLTSAPKQCRDADARMLAKDEAAIVAFVQKSMYDFVEDGLFERNKFKLGAVICAEGRVKQQVLSAAENLRCCIVHGSVYQEHYYLLDQVVPGWAVNEASEKLFFQGSKYLSYSGFWYFRIIVTGLCWPYETKPLSMQLQRPGAQI